MSAVDAFRERFESKTMPEPNSGCWLWMAYVDEIGYGITVFRRGQYKAHRVSWTIYRGEIPDGLKVLHKCDVRCCVNPDHLFLGTQADNVRDMFAKGRNRSPKPLRGDANPMARLTGEHAWAIRHMVRLKLFTQAEIARDYGVSPMTISRIINNQTWTEPLWMI